MNLVSNALKYGRVGGGSSFLMRLRRSRPPTTRGADATR